MKTMNAFLTAIIEKLTGIYKPERDFICHILVLFLSIRGRYNFLNFARYGTYYEHSYRHQFEKGAKQLIDFNQALLKAQLSSKTAIAFDPSYIAKSGKCTPFVGYYWSGAAQSMKRGLELQGLAIIDLEYKTAFHFAASPTPIDGTKKVTKEEDPSTTLRAIYANYILSHQSSLQKISKILLVDAYFSKKEFVAKMCDAGFTVISRLQKNIVLKTAYEGEQQKLGRPRVYDTKPIKATECLRNSRLNLANEDKNSLTYEGKLYVKGLEKWCKVVIVQQIDPINGKIKSATILFSTDCEMSWKEVLNCYKERFQIEFLFRDAKQHTGLEQCQSRDVKAMEFHWNCSLTAVNVAKIQHWLPQIKANPKERVAFSMANIKTQYINELMLDRLILSYGKDPKTEKNNPAIQAIYDLGRIAA